MSYNFNSKIYTMENSNLNSEELQFNQLNRSYLLETAKWSRFLSILGFIMIGLIIVLGIFVGTFMGSLSNTLGNYNSSSKLMGTGFIAGIYIVVALIYFFPCLYLFRFSTKMIQSLKSNEQEIFDQALENLKSSFKFIGILTIVIISFYLLAIIMVAFIGLSVMHH